MKEQLPLRAGFPIGEFPSVFSQENLSTPFHGIDQHTRQLNFLLRDQSGDIVLTRQVSTQPEKIQEFFHQLTQRCANKVDSFIAIVYVRDFNDWLIRMLRDDSCRKGIFLQSEERKRCKTDRRDAAALSELWWVTWDRFLEGKQVRGLRQVNICSTTEFSFDWP